MFNGGKPFEAIIYAYTAIRSKNPPLCDTKSAQIKGGGFLLRYEIFLKNAILAPRGVPYPQKKVLFWKVWIPNFPFQYPEKFFRLFKVTFWGTPLRGKIFRRAQIKGGGSYSGGGVLTTNPGVSGGESRASGDR